MMGAAMLKRHRFVRFLWRWPECVRGGVRRSPCEKIKVYLLFPYEMLIDIYFVTLCTIEQDFILLSCYLRKYDIGLAVLPEDEATARL